LLGSLPHCFADPLAETQPDLARDEGLDGDPDHRYGDREAQQTRAQADRQLVGADADPKVDDGQAAGAGQQAQPLGVVVLISPGPEEDEAGQEQEQDARVPRVRAQHAADEAAEGDAGDRRARLERGENE